MRAREVCREREAREAVSTSDLDLGGESGFTLLVHHPSLPVCAPCHTIIQLKHRVVVTAPPNPRRRSPGVPKLNAIALLLLAARLLLEFAAACCADESRSVWWILCNWLWLMILFVCVCLTRGWNQEVCLFCCGRSAKRRAHTPECRRRRRAVGAVAADAAASSEDRRLHDGTYSYALAVKTRIQQPETQCIALLYW